MHISALNGQKFVYKGCESTGYDTAEHRIIERQTHRNEIALPRRYMTQVHLTKSATFRNQELLKKGSLLAVSLTFNGTLAFTLCIS